VGKLFERLLAFLRIGDALGFLRLLAQLFLVLGELVQLILGLLQFLAEEIELLLAAFVELLNHGVERLGGPVLLGGGLIGLVFLNPLGRLAHGILSAAFLAFLEGLFQSLRELRLLVFFGFGTLGLGRPADLIQKLVGPLAEHALHLGRAI